MKLIANNGVKISRKSRPTRSNREIASWHKDLDVLVGSVERAWAAAERMRVAVEERTSQKRANLKKMSFEAGNKPGAVSK
jgi:hypothetical protein